jgi:hypothetical protein
MESQREKIPGFFKFQWDPGGIPLGSRRNPAGIPLGKSGIPLGSQREKIPGFFEIPVGSRRGKM